MKERGGFWRLGLSTWKWGRGVICPLNGSAEASALEAKACRESVSDRDRRWASFRILKGRHPCVCIYIL